MEKAVGRMRRGFHWYNAAEWAFILFLVLIVLGVASNGLNEQGIVDSLKATFIGVLNVISVLLSIPELVLSVFSEAGGIAFLLLLLAGFAAFRERLGELLLAAVFMLFLIALVF